MILLWLCRCASDIPVITQNKPDTVHTWKAWPEGCAEKQGQCGRQAFFNNTLCPAYSLLTIFTVKDGWKLYACIHLGSQQGATPVYKNTFWLYWSQRFPDTLMGSVAGFRSYMPPICFQVKHKITIYTCPASPAECKNSQWQCNTFCTSSFTSIIKRYSFLQNITPN